MDIEIYTTSACKYCAAARRLLDKRGVAYREIELDGQPGRVRELTARTGEQTTPQIFVDGEYVGGFDELVELDQDGKLG